MNPKQRASEAAMEFVHSDMVLGLGTGSTADFFLQALGAALKAGKLRDIRGVPTSLQSQRRAQELGIPLTSLAENPNPDLTVDGADEVTPELDLIKGLGGALLREKIVAQSSRRLVIVADSAKAVKKLGTKSMLPVEVAQFAYEIHDAFFKKLGAQAVLRRQPDGKLFVTDNGNFIYDCRFPNGIDDARKLEQTLRSHAGIVETGLFLGIASVALIAGDQKVERLERK